MVSIICCTMRQHFLKHVFYNYERQKWKVKELIIILNRDDMDIKQWKKRARRYPNVSVYQLAGKTTLGECLNYGIRKAKYDYIAKFDDDDYYAPYYLTQMMEVFKKTGADVVGKKTVFMYFEKEKVLTLHSPGYEHQYERRLKGATLIFKKKVCKKVMFPSKNHGEDTTFTKQCIKNNLKVYSADKFNYACLRRVTPGHHTWKAGKDGNARLLQSSQIICKMDPFDPSYISKGDSS